MKVTDIVKSKTIEQYVKGRMNMYNNKVLHKEFEGYGIITGISKTFVCVYIPNKKRKLIKRNMLMTVLSL